ncbi:MAG: hypothetical protein KDD82_13915 [Planctomycetes bacterium]|nr:hypothetical protein [Planctomycetota bacterium]
MKSKPRPEDPRPHKDPQPQTTPAPAPREDVHVAANRCPFCHDGVTPRESVVCKTCLARHHEACWGESGACASCQGSERLRSLPKVSAFTVLCLAIALAGVSVTALLGLLRDGQVSLPLAVSLGVMLSSFGVVAGRYLQDRPRR